VTSVELRPVFAVVAPMLSRAAERMWAAEPAGAHYRAWLMACYDLVRATTPLLTLALSESVRRGAHDLANYFASQAVHECGHEVWVELDWVSAGFDSKDLLDRVPIAAAARIAGAQYYWIRHAHPVALLGHIAVLEWLPPRPDLGAELMKRTGLPATAFRTLTGHAEADVHHGELLDALLSALDLPPIHRQLITTSAITTADGLVELMLDLRSAT
jgi:hypothetical protein